MNKVILLGRLTKDPEIRYSNGAEPVAVTRYALAVNRRGKKEGQPDADFFNVVVFGAGAEFAEKYFKKGRQISVVGRIQNRTWEDNGVKKYITEIVAEDQYFADSKPQGEGMKTSSADGVEGFYPVNENIEDDDLPF